jgi:3D (Asp-Asp-Asp) domain-containing protein
VNARRALLGAALCGFALLVGCGTAGSAWLAEPLPGSNYDEPLADETGAPTEPLEGRAGAGSRRPFERRVIVLGGGTEPELADGAVGAVGAAPGQPALALTESGSSEVGDGRSLGTFRNTYYDFPNERDFAGPAVALRGPRCETLKEVPRGFYDSVCVQGSGRLSTGATVSFSRRNCACAETCPRTGERICFDSLDAGRFPFGRGATGRAITPLYTVAVDSELIPLGTTIYVPELRGLPREGAGTHDGCLLAEDRGIRVKGKQVDVFTGDPRVTALYNRLLPSNRGVTVVVGSSRCTGRAR